MDGIRSSSALGIVLATALLAAMPLLLLGVQDRGAAAAFEAAGSAAGALNTVADMPKDLERGISAEMELLHAPKTPMRG